MILVVGASGLLGSDICRRLIREGESVRAMVRTTTAPEKIDALREMGAEPFYGDLKDPASLANACRGIDTVITTASTTLSRQEDDTILGVDQHGQMNLAMAAESARVGQFIYMSYSGNLDAGPDPCPLTVAKRSVEDCIRGMNMDHTILRPSCFMEVWLSPALGFDYPNAQARIYGEGTNPLSYISFGDVAEFAVRAVGNPAARNRTFELGGPAPVSQLDAVKVFESVGGTPFTVEHVPVEALEAQRTNAEDPLQKSFATLMLAVAAGDPIPMAETLGIPLRDLTSVRQYANRVL